MNVHIKLDEITKLSNNLGACTRCPLHKNGVVLPHVGKSVRGIVITDSTDLGDLKRDELIVLGITNCRGEASAADVEACRIINQFYIDNGGVLHILGLGERAKAWFSTPDDGEYDYGQWVLYLASSIASTEVKKFHTAIDEEFIPF